MPGLRPGSRCLTAASWLLVLLLSGCGSFANTITVTGTMSVNSSSDQTLTSTSEAIHTATTSSAVTTQATTTGIAKSTASTGSVVNSATSAATSLSWQQVAARLSSSVVLVHSVFPAGNVGVSNTLTGTGIVLDGSGDILTTADVVQGASAVTVAPSGSSNGRSARILGSSLCDNLAVIKADSMDGLQPATLGSSAGLSTGEPIGVFGFSASDAFGKQAAVTTGIVSNARTQTANYENLVQIDIPMDTGTSGGPVVTTDGSVVGVAITSFTPGEKGDFAIGIDQAKQLMSGLEGGHNNLWVGMNLIYDQWGPYFGQTNGVGLVVQGVEVDGPASKIGVVPAMLVTQLGGTTVNTLGDVCAILRSHNDGYQLKIDVIHVTSASKDALEGTLTVGGVAGDARSADVLHQLNPPATPSPTPAPATATPSPVTTPLPSAQYAVNKTYPFKVDDGDWPAGTYTDAKEQVSNGTYMVTVTSTNWLSELMPKSSPAGAQQYIDTTASIAGQSGNVGVLIRYSMGADGQQTFYACDIDDNGNYQCLRRDSGKWVFLQPLTKSPAIKPHGVNELQLTAVGSTIDFKVNGIGVWRGIDTQLTGGQAGLVVGTFDKPVKAVFGITTIASDGVNVNWAKPTIAAYDFKQAGDWPSGSESGVAYAISNGTYTVTESVSSHHLVTVPTSMPLGPVETISTTVSRLGPQGSTGVVGRYVRNGDSTDSFYGCFIMPGGTIDCAVVIHNAFTTLASTTKPADVHDSGVNALTMTVVGSTIDFTVNGIDEITVTDSRLTTGQPGLYVDDATTVPNTSVFGPTGAKVWQ